MYFGNKLRRIILTWSRSDGMFMSVRNTFCISTKKVTNGSSAICCRRLIMSNRVSTQSWSLAVVFHPEPFHCGSVEQICHWIVDILRNHLSRHCVVLQFLDNINCWLRFIIAHDHTSVVVPRTMAGNFLQRDCDRSTRNLSVGFDEPKWIVVAATDLHSGWWPLRIFRPLTALLRHWKLFPAG